MRNEHSPYLPGNDEAYQAWRAEKLLGYPQRAEDLIVTIQDPYALCSDEHQELLALLRKTNMVIYDSGITGEDKSLVRTLAKQFGLEHLDDNLCADEDSVTSLQVVDSGRHTGYIPYTNKPLNWHCDGYYNPIDQQIYAIAMHCVRDAAKGGESALLDHEIAYILLRDENPDYINALMQDDVMTIPPNVENGVTLRGAQSGPVFSIRADGALHMRYSARKRNIIWKECETTQKAVEFLYAILTRDDNPYLIHHRLQPGQGILCNNVLHAREGFEDAPEQGKTRLLYRARYYDRIAGTM